MGGDGKTTTLADCPPGSKGWSEYSQQRIAAEREAGRRTLVEQVGDVAAGFGDIVTFGGTRWVRNELLDCGDCVDYGSALYTSGQVTGGVTALAGGGLLIARAAGVTSRVAIHGAHHSFGRFGQLSHIQLNVWRIGVKASGRAFRIPLPWR